ncbi:hypothetical protein [Paraburkholderia sp. DGU8]|jgi:hypothetical protein|uniref:hypothetical protein n=1 Tax=Paraburkholderia sp. DGU8 TaxID=3161997 RepID=UPI00346534F3
MTQRILTKAVLLAETELAAGAEEGGSRGMGAEQAVMAVLAIVQMMRFGRDSVLHRRAV